MKVIILSASTGGGHMSAANAIKDYLISKNHTAEVIDTIEYISPFLNKTVTEIYEYVATKSPMLWKLVYKSSNNKSINRLIGSTNSLISRRLIPLLEEYQPDIIVTTHPFTTEMISKLKKHNKTNVPLVCVMTDYAPHRTWINKYVDAYVVANDDMISAMKDMGVDENIIYSFGIPVDDSFFVQKNKSEIKQEFGLKSDIPTVLIMAGSCGFANVGRIYKSLQRIKKDFQIIIITGKNPKLYKTLQKLVENKEVKYKILSRIPIKVPKFPNFKKLKFIRKFSKTFKNEKYEKFTKIVYYTNQVDKYMWISDLIITKPGGLTVSEALASNLPMALYDAIPGQEEENADFLVGNNMAVKLDSKKGVTEIIENLLENPQKLNSMKVNCENFDKSDSLKNILELLEEILINKKIKN